MDTNELAKARNQVADLEAKMLEDVKAKAALLNYDLVPMTGKSEPKIKRTRRTKAEIQAAHATQPPPLIKP